jgi:hypothetical protein
MLLVKVYSLEGVFLMFFFVFLPLLDEGLLNLTQCLDLLLGEHDLIIFFLVWLILISRVFYVLDVEGHLSAAID